jgi:hypothetical protein
MLRLVRNLACRGELVQVENRAQPALRLGSWDRVEITGTPKIQKVEKPALRLGSWDLHGYFFPLEKTRVEKPAQSVNAETRASIIVSRVFKNPTPEAWYLGQQD